YAVEFGGCSTDGRGGGGGGGGNGSIPSAALPSTLVRLGTSSYGGLESSGSFLGSEHGGRYRQSGRQPLSSSSFAHSPASKCLLGVPQNRGRGGRVPRRCTIDATNSPHLRPPTSYYAPSFLTTASASASVSTPRRVQCHDEVV
ncbi:unnamed protein product, partial [Protopolystoma xenopodis]